MLRLFFAKKRIEGVKMAKLQGLLTEKNDVKVFILYLMSNVGYPLEYVNAPEVMGQLDKLISINSCISADLYGQVCSESAGTRQISGTGGQLDFLTGAAMSKGGKAFMGQMLNICPVIHFSQEGEIVPLESVRTPKKALARTCELIKEQGFADIGAAHDGHQRLWHILRLLILC